MGTDSTQNRGHLRGAGHATGTFDELEESFIGLYGDPLTASAVHPSVMRTMEFYNKRVDDNVKLTWFAGSCQIIYKPMDVVRKEKKF